jgi:hypothetical protein
LEELHADPRHWKLAIFYVCREDPRVLVPKRIRGLGWTVNLARPATYFAVVFLCLFICTTVALAHAAGASHEAILTLKVILAFAILFFCHRAAGASSPPKS